MCWVLDMKKNAIGVEGDVGVGRVTHVATPGDVKDFRFQTHWPILCEWAV